MNISDNYVTLHGDKEKYYMSKERQLLCPYITIDVVRMSISVIERDVYLLCQAIYIGES